MAGRSQHPAESGLSPLNPLDSEVCGGSSYPLSFPSQPPDVRNWFSSYEYESPECSGLVQDLHSFILPAEEERETQDPLGNSPKKAVVPPTVEDKHLAESPLILVTEIIPLKENTDQNLLPEVQGKSSGKHDGSENADSNCNLSRVDEKLVKGHEQSPKWIPAKTECKEHVSHRQNSREINPISPQIHADFEVARELPREEGVLPRSNIGKDGFVSVKRKDNMRGSGETFTSNLSSRVKYEDLIAVEGTDIIGMPSHGKRENHKLSPCHDRLRRNSFLPLKRKQDLQQPFGDGFLTKYSKEENNDLIPSKMYRSSVKQQECSPKVLTEMNECKENLGAQDWRRDDNSHTASKIKEGRICQERGSFLRCTDEGLKENAVMSGFVSTKNREIALDDNCNLPPKSISAMNYRDIAFSNGMIRRETNEHLMNGDYIFLENNGNLEGKEEAQKCARSPLADKTNFQAGVVAVAPEIPGKWRCPRRSKPYMGPQLKQLRLERWVHRAT